MPAPTVNLIDLNTFGIHVNNPLYKCCRCGASTRGWSEGVTADDLCQQCSYARIRVAGRAVEVDRREAQFYVAQTVWVMEPQVFRSKVRAIWNGAELSPMVRQMVGIVKIDGVLYRVHGDSVAADLIDKHGTRVRRSALRITERRLHQIHALQKR